MGHGFLVHSRGKFRGQIEGLKIKVVLFSRSEFSPKVPKKFSFHNHITSHLNLPPSGFRGRFR